ncbi:MAG: hypothetical protein IT342_21375 [Candidatus Melainabacteria bacterium]|nr:hypothetical protein [Candidatus Melainabacteria bacterium]
MYDKSEDIPVGSGANLDQSLTSSFVADTESEFHLDDMHTSWSGRSRGPQPQAVSEEDHSFLTEEERRAICLRYGIGTSECKTLNAIAASEGQTVATVRRLLNSAMKKLKRRAAALRET